jgi:hypothetical protein
MVQYAKGTKSRAMCDRCGFEVPYTDLKKEWNGLMVCQMWDCYEPKHPQLEPRTVSDAEALRNPRPDTDTEA